MPRSRLLERDAELAALDRLIDAADRGGGAVALVQGPPGIGKTRLVTEARERAGEAGLETLAARGGELERDVAWGVVRALLEPALARRTEEERADLLSGAARLAGPILGHGGDQNAAMAGPEAIGAALQGLYWLIANIAERSPLLAVVDDAHWADAASLRWLAYMARRIEELPILLLVACRQAEPGVDLGVIAALAAEPAARTLMPAPLTDSASKQMVRSTLSGDADDAFCRACHAATRGNPFLLHELLGQLAADGVEPTETAAASIKEMRSETISRAVLLRLRRLPDGARTLVRAAAVLEPLATVAQAAALADMEGAEAAAAADALAAADILALDRPLEFVHPLVWTAVYEDIPEAQRSLMHARAARLLERHGMDLGDRAVHLLAAEPAADLWCVTTLSRAATAALDVGAPDAAAAYLRRALEEPPPPEERGALLRRLGLAEASAGLPEATEHLSAALDHVSDSIERAHVTLDLGRALINVGELERACAVLERSIGELDGRDRDLALQLEAELLEAAGYGLSLRPIFVERLGRLRPEELEGATLGERLVLARVALDLALGSGTAREAAETARRALAGGRLLAEAADSQGSLDAADALLLADQIDEAERAYDEALAHARARGSPLGVAQAMSYSALVAYRRGHVDDAVAAARETIDALAVGGWEFGMPLAAGPLAEALIERGELEQADAALERGARNVPSDGFPFNRILYTRGRLRLAEGAVTDGVEHLLECGRRLKAWGAHNPSLLPWRSIAAPALALLGRQEDAARLAREELQAAGRFGARQPLGIALHAAGLVEGADGGIARLREAVEVLAGSHGRLEEARARTDLGAALRRAGRRRECMDPLREGLDLASACGATALAERARQELTAAGARPRRDALRGRDALTATERRVAEMAAAGLTNRDIAQALFVTLRTVETHLTHAYPKLGIRSRRELPEALRTARR